VLYEVAEETETVNNFVFGVVAERLKNSGKVSLCSSLDSWFSLIFKDLDQLSSQFHDLRSHRRHLCKVVFDALHIHFVHVVVLLGLAQNDLRCGLD
jgi:hypothetical protein